MRINGIILAAGQSSRLGHDKQLVNFKGNSLMRHTEYLIQPLVNQLYVILGYNHENIQKELKTATCLVNKNWQLGMGNSLSFGIAAAQKNADSILIALCDQPRIPQSHYINMITAAKRHNNHIITTAYAGINGVPTVFPKHHFNELTSMTGSQGARGIIERHAKQVIALNCEHAEFDVDSNKHLEQL